ncbi:MAG: CHAT domain-containing protein, partial [Bacteroidota bacterium]
LINNVRDVDAILADHEQHLKAENYYDYIYELNERYRGRYYVDIGAYSEAKSSFEYVLRATEQQAEQDLGDLSKILLDLGNLHKKMGNQEIALGYLKRSLAAALDYPHTTIKYRALVHKHIGDVYTNMRQYDQAHRFYQQASSLSSIPKGRKERNGYATLQHALAALYLAEGKTKAAEDALNKARRIHEPDDPFQTKTYLQLAKLYATQPSPNYERAQSILKTALKTNKNNGKSRYATQLYNALAETYLAQQDFSSALTYVEKALEQLSPQTAANGSCLLPELNSNFAWEETLAVLQTKADILYQRREEASLYCAFETAQLGLQLIDQVRVGSITDYSKELLLDKSASFFATAIAISHALQAYHPNDLQYWQFAFDVAEKSKALLLLTAFRNTQAEQYDLDETLRSKELWLRHKISALLNDDQLTNETLDTLTQLEQEWTKLTETIKEEEPEYYKTKFLAATTAFEELSSRLEGEQMMIEYFVGEDSTWLFAVHPHAGLRVVPISIGKHQLEKKVTRFNQAIKNYPEEKAKIRYPQLAYDLYQLLLAPIERYYPLPEKLLIIPHGVLCALPFDALLSQPVPESKLSHYQDQTAYSFLLYQSSISYCYSATLLHEMQTALGASRQSSQQLLGFSLTEFEAHITTIEETFNSWWNGRESVNNLGIDSHKQMLFDIGQNYRFIHFSVHGEIDLNAPNQSHLKLRNSPTDADSLFYVKELYHTKLPADMVVAAACSAGVGQIHEGEGMLSLTRGFTYAGTKSLVTTLWDIEQGPTQVLLENFYKNIGSGFPKDEALTSSKKAYIASFDDTSCHPKYWAAFIPIGDMNPVSIQEHSFFSKLLKGVVMLAGLYLIFVLVKRRK